MSGHRNILEASAGAAPGCTGEYGDDGSKQPPPFLRATRRVKVAIGQNSIVRVVLTRTSTEVVICLLSGMTAFEPL